jgi:hypothetical protein
MKDLKGNEPSWSSGITSEVGTYNEAAAPVMASRREVAPYMDAPRGDAEPLACSIIGSRGDTGTPCVGLDDDSRLFASSAWSQATAASIFLGFGV